MAGSRAGLRAVTVVTVLLGATASPVAAAEPVARMLAEAVLAGVTVDLDGDGAREIVAIVPAESGQDLEAWREADGAWEPVGSVTLQGSAGAGTGLRALAATDGSGLLVAEDGAAERLLLATTPTSDESLSECCVALFEVGLEADRLIVEPLARDLGRAAGLTAADLDADGRDEIVVTAPVDPAGPATPFEDVRVLSWSDGGIAVEALRYPEDAGLLMSIGDSDGVPGADLHFMAGRVVTRIAAANDGLVTESGVLPDGSTGRSGEWMVGATAGTIVTVDGTSRISTFRWPRRDRPTSVASATMDGSPSVFVLGDGPDARIVAVGGTSRTEFPMRTVVYDLDLEPVQEIVPSPAVAAMLEVAASGGAPLEDSMRARPQFGPIGATAGREAAFLLPGSLLELGSDGELSVRPTVPFAGEGALALAGRDAGWLASGLGWNSFYATSTYLYGGIPATRLAVVPLDALAGSPAGTPPEVRLDGGVLVEGPDGAVLYAGDRSVEIHVRASHGAWAVARVGSRTTTAPIDGEQATLHVRPRPAEVAGAPDRAIVVVVEPGGIAHVATWAAVVLDAPPILDAASGSQLFGLTSRVTGRVRGTATLTVGGVPVELQQDGSFALELDAPIWGRDVLVRAVDPLGQETVELVTVVGFVDYRGLPWLAIIGGLTVAIGLVLFMRVPRLRPAGATVGSDGDGVLEEMDEDRG